MKYVLIGVIVVILAYVGYLASNNPNLLQVKVEKSVSATEQWNVYSNSKYGLEISYPTDFIVEQTGDNPYEIHFGTTLINRGNIYLKVFDTTRYSIKNLDDISYINKGASDTPVSSSKDGTNNNGITFREIQSVQRPSANMATILFIRGNNAYELNWSCWPSKPCFDDQSLEKMLQSIKFSN